MHIIACCGIKKLTSHASWCTFALDLSLVSSRTPEYALEQKECDAQEHLFSSLLIYMDIEPQSSFEKLFELRKPTEHAF